MNDIKKTDVQEYIQPIASGFKFENIKSLLLIQLGDIGDVVWTTPIFRAVREAYAHIKIAVLVRNGNGAFIKADPHVDVVYEIPPKIGKIWSSIRNYIAFLKSLRAESFDIVFDLRADERGAYTSFLTGAPIRVAQRYDHLPFWRNLLFTQLIDPPPQGVRPSNAAEQSLRIVRSFGIDAKSPIPELFISEETKREIANIFDWEGICSEFRFITISPFSRWKYKEWPYERWVDVIDFIWQEFGIGAVIVGSESDFSSAESIRDCCSGQVYNFAGKTSLDKLAGLLKMSLLHIGVDSAPPHIAAAVGTPTVSIYGPTDPMYWLPPGKQHRIVRAEMDCLPCRKKGCEDTGISKCLNAIEAFHLNDVITNIVDDMAR